MAWLYKQPKDLTLRDRFDRLLFNLGLTSIRFRVDPTLAPRFTPSQTERDDPSPEAPQAPLDDPIPPPVKEE